MKPSITVITLGVNDLQKSLAFYRDGMGLPTEGIIGTEFEFGAVVFFKLKNGLTLALWPKSSLSKEANIPVVESGTPPISIGHNVMSREEVDQVMAQAKRAGAKIVVQAEDRFWGGYSGYFQDPDGYLWEVVWNPDLLPE